MTARLLDTLRHLLLIAALLSAAGGNPSGTALSSPADTFSSYLPYVGYTSAIQIARYSPACTRANALRILGDVTNNGSRPAYDVAVEMQVYDNSGNLLEVQVATPLLTATLPSQLNPFEKIFFTECTTETYYELEVISWVWESDQSYLPLTVVYPVTIEDFGLGAWVNVEFRNDAGSPLSAVRGVAWSTEQIFSIQPHLLTDSLAPGETITMTEYIDGVYGVSISTIRVAGQGLAVP